MTHSSELTPPLVVIVGPTGSGKSALAVDLAQKFDGEIICADSRTIYKYLDIGTAKPSQADMQLIPHHMLDLIEPSEQYSASLFKDNAESIIDDIKNRDKLPILVGGTGLYIDAILYDYQFSDLPDAAERDRLSALSINELQAEIRLKGLSMPTNSKNPRHLMRMIETGGVSNVRKDIRADALIFGVTIDRIELSSRIKNRTQQMIQDGLMHEVKSVAATYGWSAPGLQAPAYKAFKEHIEGSATLVSAAEEMHRQDMQLAKRQMTWFRRNKSIHWIYNTSNIVDLLTARLNKS